MQTLLQWKNNNYYIFWVCVCILSYPTCNVHVSCCNLWPVLLTISYHIISQMAQLSIEKKNGTEHTMCVDTFSTTLSATFIILRGTEGDKIKNIYWSSCKVSIIHVSFFSTYFWKILKISNFMKIHPVEAKLFYLDSQKDGYRDMTMLTVRFSLFCAHS
jgi:hypothetical protein